MKKTLVLNDDDFYHTSNGLHLRGGNRMLYEASLVVKFNRDGGYEVLKDRFGLDKEQIESEIGLIPDQRLLLMLA
jgi:hypothetical protein